MGSISPESTMLQIFDHIAANDPQRLYFIQPVSSDISEGWEDILFPDLVGAINRMALWIQENVTTSSQGETLAYVATNDIRYVAFIFACMRLRHTVSMRLSPKKVITLNKF